MNTTSKQFYSVHKSKKYHGKFRIVQWIGSHPNTTIKTISDNLGYGEAVLKIKNKAK